MVNIVTVVKYKVKEGYEDAFVAAINDYDYSKSNFMRLIRVAHMLEFFGESRTDAYSGIVMAEFSNADIFK